MQSPPKDKSNTSQKTAKTGSIRNTFLLVLLPISILSIIIVAGITFLRGRNAIENQVNSNLNANANALKTAFNNWDRKKLIRLDLATRGSEFQHQLEESTLFPDSNEHRETILNELKRLTQRGNAPLFNNFIITLTNGEVLFSTQRDWENLNISDTYFYQSLSTRSRSIVVHGPEQLYESETVAITSIPFFDQKGQHRATVFGLSGSISLLSLLEEVSRFNPNARSYLVTQSGDFIQIEPYQKTLDRIEPSASQAIIIMEMMDSSRQEESIPGNIIFETISFDGAPVISYFTWLPSLETGVVIEVPTSIAFGELNALSPFLLGVTLILGVIVAIIIIVVTQRLVRPIQQLTGVTTEFASGNWDQRASEFLKNEIGQLSRAFNLMANELSETYRSLEAQVQERTKSLEVRSRQLEATAQVASEAAAIQNLEELLSNATNFISDRFDYYHVGIFLLDPSQQFAVLRATNSPGGQKMLARSHRLQVGQVGIVGYAAGTALPKMALDVGEDAHYFDNPDLPNTRSELALPLKIHDQVIGVLDVQSLQPNDFTGSEVEVLQILADQIAIAIENARLLEEREQAIHELQRITGEQLRSDWNRWGSNQVIGYAFDLARIDTITSTQISTARSVSSARPEIVNKDGKTIITAPIQLREQKLGMIILERDESHNPWTQDDLNLVQTSLNQISIALENARLLEESLRLAEHEKTVSEFSTQFSQILDIDSILKAAIKNLSQLPNVADVSINIGNMKTD